MKKTSEEKNIGIEKINVRGIFFDNVNMEEAVEKCRELFVSGGKPKIIHTPNAEVVQLCVEQPDYYSLINGADLIIPDGAGVILASKILKTPLKKGRVPGVELGDRLAETAAESGWKLFLYGGQPGVAELAAEKLTEKYPRLNICGICHGYVKEYGEVIEKINASGAELLFICTGAPRQEKWMRENIDKLNVKLMAGLGGSIDIYSGNVKRAPLIFRKLNLEWLHRLIGDPKRIRRMMKLPKFIIGTVFYSIKNKN